MIKAKGLTKRANVALRSIQLYEQKANDIDKAQVIQYTNFQKRLDAKLKIY